MFVWEAKKLLVPVSKNYWKIKCYPKTLFLISFLISTKKPHFLVLVTFFLYQFREQKCWQEIWTWTKNADGKFDKD